MKIRVYYEDTDIGGVVYYANYLKFCERARSNIFFEKGLSPHNNNEFFVVKKVEADYIKSATFADELEVTSKVISKKNASLEIFHEIFRKEELIFTAKVKLAYLKDYKPTKIPKEILEIFA
ncbi:YbgC/FadM family acyl-CoA thioesterase [Halarcobacter bivalviorum]|uniref:YbgC/FadM family acyl-CoA thioesterase n=1 Tax=Halarcobacter bivalviorum TaxID=663364 RepID=UPI00100A8048|nr:YbgC/FadM family acyl-CoA thioesterase [Halarcobacter bivalviorum]RXK07846.1 acyl-CoA thioester hydrolase [Halarcobacter bivalviorum]